MSGFQKCGGCQYQHLRYKIQLEWKTRQVKELLWHMARIKSEVLPAIPSPKTYGYRSKLTPHFPKPKAGKPIEIGFLKQGTRSKYIEIEQCPLVSATMNQELKRLREHTQNLHQEKPFKKGATLLLREHLDGISTDPKEIIRSGLPELSSPSQQASSFKTILAYLKISQTMSVARQAKEILVI